MGAAGGRIEPGEPVRVQAQQVGVPAAEQVDELGRPRVHGAPSAVVGRHDQLGKSNDRAELVRVEGRRRVASRLRPRLARQRMDHPRRLDVERPGPRRGDRQRQLPQYLAARDTRFVRRRHDAASRGSASARFQTAQTAPSAAKPVAGSVFGPSPHRPRTLRLGTHFVAFHGADS